jgi:hypothetical protein
VIGLTADGVISGQHANYKRAHVIFVLEARMDGVSRRGKRGIEDTAAYARACEFEPPVDLTLHTAARSTGGHHR